MKQNKYLLYLDECDCEMSRAVLARKDLIPILLRPKKAVRFLTQQYIDDTKDQLIYVFDSENIDEETKRFGKWCEEQNIKVDFVGNDSEYYMQAANHFFRNLGFDAVTDEQVSWVRDKVKMKQKVRELGFNVVEFSAVKDLSEIRSFIGKVGYPVVLKPRSGMNSRDTYIVHNDDELCGVPLDYSSGKYMIEQFCFGKEYPMDTIVQNGKALQTFVTYISEALMNAAYYNRLNIHLTCEKTPEVFAFDPNTEMQKLITGLGLKNGDMTMELFVGENGEAILSEFGWRTSGYHAIENHSRSYGFDMYNTIIDIWCGIIHSEFPYAAKGSVGALYINNKEGLITHIDSTNQLKKMPGVIDAKVISEKGRTYHRLHMGNNNAAWALIQGSTKEEVLEYAKDVFRLFKIEVEENDENSNQ